MTLLTHIREALANLVTAKLRSFLAILGILVGTASVVALITSSELGTRHALSQFETLGTNLLSMNVQTLHFGKTTEKGQQHNLVLDDIPILKSTSPQISLIGPYISVYKSIRAASKQRLGQAIGVTDDFPKIVRLHLANGRFVSYLDKNKFYCDIGSDVLKLFQQKGITNPIGQQIFIGNWLFTVVGVLRPWKPNWFVYASINKGALIPLRTAYLLSNSAAIKNVLFRLTTKADITSAQQAIKSTIEKILPGQRITFHNPNQIINIMSKQKTTFALLLGSIGGISLLVGGIGVMNIMLVSVVERRREIGIRMAIGARRADIRRMFLIEAIILTVIGGIIGILLGLLISFLLAFFSHWKFMIPIIPPTLGFAVSLFVGIVSGFYPAYRASKLDPIQTLRSV